MLDEHLLNENQEENDERIVPYVTKVLKKAESIHGGKKYEEPRTYYNLGRLNEHVGDYTMAMNYYMLAHRAGERRADREIYEQIVQFDQCTKTLALIKKNRTPIHEFEFLAVYFLSYHWITLL